MRVGGGRVSVEEREGGSMQHHVRVVSHRRFISANGIAFWRVIYLLLVACRVCDGKDMYDHDFGEGGFTADESKYQLLFTLEFSERLAQNASISKHLVIVQHEKQECHADERSQSKYS